MGAELRGQQGPVNEDCSCCVVCTLHIVNSVVQIQANLELLPSFTTLLSELTPVAVSLKGFSGRIIGGKIFTKLHKGDSPSVMAIDASFSFERATIF